MLTTTYRRDDGNFFATIQNSALVHELLIGSDSAGGEQTRKIWILFSNLGSQAHDGGWYGYFEFDRVGPDSLSSSRKKKDFHLG